MFSVRACGTTHKSDDTNVRRGLKHDRQKRAHLHIKEKVWCQASDIRNRADDIYNSLIQQCGEQDKEQTIQTGQAPS
jgi:hypothetical protein